MRVIIVSEVAHEGMASVSHDRVANTKMAITRCWITVRPSIQKLLVGRFQMMAVTMTIVRSSHTFFISILLDNTFSSDMSVIFYAIVSTIVQR